MTSAQQNAFDKSSNPQKAT